MTTHKAGARREALPVMLLAMTGLLPGCATPPATKAPPYVAPTSGPTARLVMRSSNLPPTEAYGVLVHDDASNCRGPRLAGAGNATRNPTTVALVAGSLATVDFVLVKNSKTEKPQVCLLRWSFTPEAGKSYLVQGTSTAAGCTARLLDATNPDAMRLPGGTVRRNIQGQACVPMAQAQAAANAVGGQSDGAAVLRPAATTDDLQGLIGK
jgi:hypothetical protein